MGMKMYQILPKIKGTPSLLEANKINTTLIREAIQKKRFDVVKWLVKEKLVYIFDTTCCDGILALLNIQDNILETLETLKHLSYGYSVITKKLRYVNMHKAVREAAILYWLLQHGGNIAELDHNGSTLLHLAIKEKLVDVFYLLLELGADINAQDSQGNTPLHLAVVNSEEMTLCLIQHGCNIDVKNQNDETPLFLAVGCNSLEVVCILLCYNADTEIGYEGFTPLMKSLCFLNNNDMSKMLLEYTRDINATTNLGWNALCFAMINNNPLEVEIMRRGGLWPNYALFLNTTYLAAKFVCIHYDNYRLGLLFFCRFLSNHSFPTEEWIKYLHLFLRSQIGDAVFSLAERSHLYEYPGNRFLSRVLTAFRARDVRKEDRIEILKMLFERRIEIELFEICQIYNFYGFNDEFELLFKLPLNIGKEEINRSYNYVAKLILDFESFANDRLGIILAHYFTLAFCRIISETPTGSTARGILALGTFISIRQYVLKLNESQTNGFEIMKVINEMPIVPSCQELSRNAVRAAIGRKFPGRIPSFYQKCLDKLSIPSSIVDIIRLKVPIYKDFTPLLLRINSEQLKIESDRFNGKSMFFY